MFELNRLVVLLAKQAYKSHVSVRCCISVVMAVHLYGGDGKFDSLLRGHFEKIGEVSYIYKLLSLAIMMATITIQRSKQTRKIP